MKIDHSNTREIVCPWCGYVYSNSWEYNDWSGVTIDCGNCGEEFKLFVDFTVDYTTTKIILESS